MGRAEPPDRGTAGAPDSRTRPTVKARAAGARPPRASGQSTTEARDAASSGTAQDEASIRSSPDGTHPLGLPARAPGVLREMSRSTRTEVAAPRHHRQRADDATG